MEHFFYVKHIYEAINDLTFHVEQLKVNHNG